MRPFKFLKSLNWYLIGWITVVTLGEIQFGYLVGEFTLMLDVLPWIYEYGENDIVTINSVLNTAGPFGAVFGAVITGPLSYYGRRNWLFISNSLVIAACSLRMIKLIPILFFARVIFGIAVGILSTIIPLFVIEISPIKMKGAYGAVCQLFITIGILLSYIFGLFIPTFVPGEVEYCENFNVDGTHWRINFALPIFPAVFQILTLRFYYKLETPKFYIIQEEYYKATECLARIHSSKVKWKEETGSFTDTTYLKLSDMVDCIDPNTDGRTFKALMRSKYRQAFLVGIMLCVIQQLSGINMIIFYSNQIVISRK